MSLDVFNACFFVFSNVMAEPETPVKETVGNRRAVFVSGEECMVFTELYLLREKLGKR